MRSLSEPRLHGEREGAQGLLSAQELHVRLVRAGEGAAGGVQAPDQAAKAAAPGGDDGHVRARAPQHLLAGIRL